MLYVIKTAAHENHDAIVFLNWYRKIDKKISIIYYCINKDARLKSCCSVNHKNIFLLA